MCHSSSWFAIFSYSGFDRHYEFREFCCDRRSQLLVEAIISNLIILFSVRKITILVELSIVMRYYIMKRIERDADTEQRGARTRLWITTTGWISLHQTFGIWIVERKPNSTLYSFRHTSVLMVRGYCPRYTTGKVHDVTHNLRTGKTVEVYISLFQLRIVVHYPRSTKWNDQWFDIEEQCIFFNSFCAFQLLSANIVKWE